MKIKCPNKDCGKILIVDSDMAGKKGKCSTCDAIFTIPGTPNPAAPPGSGTVNLASSPSGALSAEQKKASASDPRKSVKRRPGSKSGESKRSAEKPLDDYVEEPRPKKKRTARKEPDDYAVEEVDYVDYDDYEEDRPRRRSRPQRRPHRAAGGREVDYEDYEDYDDYLEEDDYEDDYEDSYGTPVRSGSRGSRRKRGPNIGLIRAGFMVMAIAGCVFSGAIGIKILVELIAILSDFGIGSTSQTIWKTAELLWMGAAFAVIVGYSFLLFLPNKNSSRGLTVAALVIGSINFVLLLVLKVIPLYSEGRGFLGLGFGGLGFGGRSTLESLLKLGLMEGLFIAEMVLVALAFMAINKQLKDRYNLQSAKRMIIPAGIYGGILVVVAMFILILSESKITSPTAFTIWKWVFYLLRVGSQGMLLWYFVSYILLMFNTRSAMPKS